MSVTKLLAISLGAILTNNFIFSQFLGICPFLGVSKKSDTPSVWVLPLRSSWALPRRSATA